MFFRERQQQKYTAITSPDTVKALFPNEAKSLDSFRIDIETVQAVLPNISELLSFLKEPSVPGQVRQKFGITKYMRAVRKPISCHHQYSDTKIAI